MTTRESITSGQRRQFLSIVEAAYDEVCVEQGLDKGGMQNMLERGDELKSKARAFYRDALQHLSVVETYKNEEVRSNYVYPNEYKGPKAIAHQILAVAKIFDLDASQAMEYAKHLPALPPGAEGYFTIPSVDALARKYFPEVTDPAEKYCRAVQFVFRKIAESRPFYNCREGQIDKDHLRMTERTAQAMAKIAASQPGDILIIAAQLGLKYGGKSVRRSRVLFQKNEFGLTSLAAGSIALVHPERFVRWEELDIDCSGDEFAPDGDGVFSNSPYLNFNDGRVRFDAIDCSNYLGFYGSASAFLEQ